MKLLNNYEIYESMKCGLFSKVFVWRCFHIFLDIAHSLSILAEESELRQGAKQKTPPSE